MNMQSIYHGAVTAVFLMIAVMVSGCASSPQPRLYVFSTDGKEAEAVSRSTAESKYTVRIKALQLPQYIDRPQIVSRISPGELNADEFNRWGIPLSSSLARELAMNLMSDLPDAYVDINSWKGQKDTTYLVDLDIIHLDGQLGGAVVLEAQWSVSKPGAPDEPATIKLSSYQRKTSDKTYESYVETMKLIVEDLGKDIAEVIKEQSN